MNKNLKVKMLRRLQKEYSEYRKMVASGVMQKHHGVDAGFLNMMQKLKQSL